MINQRDQILSVSTTLFQTEQLRVQCSVSLFDNEEKTLKYFHVFSTEKGKYVSVEPKASLKIKYSPKIGSVEYMVNMQGNYDRQSQIYVSPMYLYGLKKAMEFFWERFNREGMYEYNEYGYPVSFNAVKEDIVLVPLGYGQVFRMAPSIYYPPERKPGEAQESYPGIAVNINREAYEVNLTVEEFAYLMEVLQKFDYVTMGHQLLQEYLLLKDDPQLQGANFSPDGQRYSKPVAKEVSQRALDQFRREEMTQSESVSEKPLMRNPTSLDDL